MILRVPEEKGRDRCNTLKNHTDVPVRVLYTKLTVSSQWNPTEA